MNESGEVEMIEEIPAITQATERLRGEVARTKGRIEDMSAALGRFHPP